MIRANWFNKTGSNMATMKEMAEAHLLNVQREIQNLSAKRGEIDNELKTLNEYLLEGSKVLSEDTAETEGSAE
tara:strand:- start:5833 stop:6051 length:219 start_codon:yes stop_codon:yes gene_type:complete